MDPVALFMKTTTLLGVATASVVLALPHVQPRWRIASLALAGAGLALMFVNARIAASPTAPLLDAAYLGGVGATLVHVLRHGLVARASRKRLTRFEVVAEAPAR